MNAFFNRLLLIGSFTALLAVPSLQAQMKGWEIGPWAGVSYYLGDLNTRFDFSRPNLAGGFGARYNFNNRLGFRLSGNYGKVEAYDSDSPNPFERTRNLSFESTVLDGTLQFEFNFLPYEHGSYDHFFTPYVFGGLSAFYFNPKAELDGTLYELRSLGTEGQLRGQEYYEITGALTYGLGVKVDLSYEWSLDFSLGMRNTFTDYLDDVSTIYPDLSDLRRTRINNPDVAVALSDRSLYPPGQEPVSRKGEQRGDSTNKDKYLFLGVGINYYFGDVRCPDYGKRK